MMVRYFSYLSAQLVCKSEQRVAKTSCYFIVDNLKHPRYFRFLGALFFRVGIVRVGWGPVLVPLIAFFGLDAFLWHAQRVSPISLHGLLPAIYDTGLSRNLRGRKENVPDSR